MAEISSFRKSVYFVLFWALIGGGVAAWLAPKLIAWYFDPPVSIGVNCRPAVEWGMYKLQLAQLLGTAGGGALGLGILLLWKKRESIP